MSDRRNPLATWPADGVLRPFAGGDLVSRQEPPASPLLRVESHDLGDAWWPRSPGSPTVPLLAGTAVSIAGEWYEVTAIEAGREGRVAYLLDPWPEAEPIRRVAEYSRQAVETRRKTLRQDRRRRTAASTLALSLPLVGLLPAVLQERVEREHGIPAARATTLSALFVLGFSFAAFVLGLAASMAPGFGAGGGTGAAWLQACEKLLPVALYFTIESFFRLGGGAGGEPVGSLPVALPVLAYLTLRGRSQQRPGAEPALAPAGPAPDPASMWAETFAPLWGLCRPTTQRRLAERFGHEAHRHSRDSILVAAATAVAAIAMATTYLVQGRGNVLDVAVLLGGSALGLESGRRWRNWSHGELTGSALGRFVEPWAERLLRGSDEADAAPPRPPEQAP